MTLPHPTNLELKGWAQVVAAGDGHEGQVGRIVGIWDGDPEVILEFAGDAEPYSFQRRELKVCSGPSTDGAKPDQAVCSPTSALRHGALVQVTADGDDHSGQVGRVVGSWDGVDLINVEFDGDRASYAFERAELTPVYVHIGYKADGQPVTADRLLTASSGSNPLRTNTLAIATLIMALIFPLAAIPMGHIAQSQIRASGERGGSLAIAGLIISYLWLIGLMVVGIVLLGTLVNR
jgi:hypothetical protein